MLENIENEFKKVICKVDKSRIESNFVSYVSSLFYYNSLNYDKNIRKHSERFLLVLDDQEDRNTQSTFLDSNENSIKLEEHIVDPQLYKAFLSLTDRERKILNLSVYDEISDTKIASMLNVSQQSISKSKSNALKKLRKSIERND